MLSINSIKFVNSLHQKKQRDKQKLFLVEGDKMVREYLFSTKSVQWLFAKPEWIASIPDKSISRVPNVFEVSYEELKKISSLKTPHNAMALVSFSDKKLIPSSLQNSITIVLDNVQDPGNLGTIIRIAGWFGVQNIVCSKGCVDLYNPKVVQSTMGAMLNVDVHYTNLPLFLAEVKRLGIPIIGTSLSGKSLYQTSLPASAIVIFGNESKGVSEDIANLSDYNIIIPPFGNENSGIESLNVGVSTAIVCSELRRQQSLLQ
jgi:TrmH family RNA methyltransferase